MMLFTDRPGDEGLPGRRRALAMAAVMISTLMAVFDGSMVNIALPQMATALKVSAGTAIWFANGYLLSAAMTLAIFAALASRYGFRPLFLFGVTLFTAASLGCALSTSATPLLVMRILQGIGGAATLSIAPAILRTVFPDRLLGRILGLNALLIAASTAAAPVIGGMLLAALHWQWIFLINIVPGIAALFLAKKALPEQPRSVRAPFDCRGALLSAAMPGSLIMAANSFSVAGKDLHKVSFNSLFWCSLALISLLAFIAHLRRSRNPLLPPAIFSSPRFSLAALTSLSSFISQGIAFVALPFLLQNVYGYSAFTASLLFAPWPAGIVLIAPHAGRLADKHSPATISTIGLALFVGGLLLLALLPERATMFNIGLATLICGLGFGCFQSPNNREMLGNVIREYSGYASGVLAIVRTFGQCLGAALVCVILATVSKTFLPEQQAIRTTLWLAVIASGLAVAFSISRLRRR